MSRMLVDGVNLFPILQDSQQLKQLCQFYKVLATLWLQDDFIHQFERNVAQLNPICQHIVFAEDIEAMRSDPERRKQIMQVLQMLRGIFQAANSFKNFQLVFDWFAEHLKLLEKVVTVYSMQGCDDEVLLLAFKFMLELADNSSNRLRFDTWSINGLIVFKEIASHLTNFFSRHDFLSTTGKPVQADAYKERFKYLKRATDITGRFVLGNYINFAMCEYYNDDSFSQLINAVFRSLLNVDMKQLAGYSKLHRKILMFVEEFFKRHLELTFLKLDFELIIAVVNQLLFPNLGDSEFAIKSNALLSLDSLNEFIFNNLRKPSKKRPELAQKVQQFYNKYQIFEDLLRRLTFCLFFEDHKNIWVFQKCLHSTIVMVEGGAPQPQNSLRHMMNVVQQNEFDEEQRNKVLQVLQVFLMPDGKAENFPADALDMRSRDKFQPLFTLLKNFIQDCGPR